MANSGLLLAVCTAGTLAGWAALVCGLMPPAYQIYYYVEEVGLEYRTYWMHLPFAVAAGLVALRQLFFSPAVGRSPSPDQVTKSMMKPWHRSMVVLRRMFHTPCWLTWLGVPPSLCLLDVVIFAGFCLLNWCLLGIVMDRRLGRGEAGCRYMRPKDHKPSLQREGFFTWVGMENFALYTGVLSNIMIGWYCVLPVSRRSVFLEALDVSWESAIKYHRWIGFHTTFVTFLHTVCYVAVWIYANGKPEFDPSGQMLKHNMLPWGCADGSCTQSELLDLAINMWGFGAFFLMLVMVAFSLPVVRRRCYELFYFLHMLWIPMVVAAQIHCGTIYYLAPGLACHCVDKTLGLLAHFGNIRARIQRLAPDIVEIVVPTVSSYSIKSGQYVLLNTPELSVMQWHPLSVTWAREDVFALHIRAAGDWSEALHALAGRGSEVKVKVKGAFGTDATNVIWGKDALVLWAGGLGVTYIYSVAQQAARSGTKVFFRFVVRTKTEERSFADLLTSLEALSPQVNIKMWVTRPDSAHELEEEYGTATCSNSSLPALDAASGDASAPVAKGSGFLMMPLSSVVPRPVHAVMCGVAIFAGFAGLEVARDVTRNMTHPYHYPLPFYYTELRGFLYPFLFIMAAVVSLSLILAPLSYYMQKPRAQQAAEEQRQSLAQPQEEPLPGADAAATTVEPSFSIVRGCRPDMTAEWDAIASELGAAAADVAVFVAGPNGLVDAVETECGKRAWHVHRWLLDAEAWEW